MNVFLSPLSLAQPGILAENQLKFCSREAGFYGSLSNSAEKAKSNQLADSPHIDLFTTAVDPVRLFLCQRPCRIGNWINGCTDYTAPSPVGHTSRGNGVLSGEVSLSVTRRLSVLTGDALYCVWERMFAYQ